MLILPPLTLRVADLQLSFAIVSAPERAPGSRRRNGGKDPAQALLRSVKLSSKRGRVLRWFLHSLDATVATAMIEFKLTRPAVFATWTTLNQVHGIGYAFDAEHDALLVRLPCDEAELWS